MKARLRRHAARTGAVALVVPGVLVLAAVPALAAVTPAASAQTLSDAITATPGMAIASYAPLSSVTANGIGNAPLAGFPTNGSTFGVMTTGNATIADSPNTAQNTGYTTLTSQVRGTDTIYDLTTLKLANIFVPNDGCEIRFTYRFFSEEFPEFVGQQYNDVFVAELDANTWTSNGGALNTPNAFVTQTVATSAMTVGAAAGTTYDGATDMLTGSVTTGAGTHTVYLSIGDRGDDAYDSAVFLDDLRVVCPTFPPAHVTIHRFPTGTLLLASPNGWTCVDVNTNAVVSAGSSLTEPNAGVSCVPPDAFPKCHSVTAGGYHAAAGSGTLIVTSSCTGLSVSQSMTLPFNNPGVSNTVTGVGTFPWRCVTDDSGIARNADYWVFCHVNIP